MFKNLLNYTTKKILTLDKVDGFSIEQEKLEKLGINPKGLAENLIQFLKQAVRDGFHGDMHQGNLFVDEKGNIILWILG